MTATGTVLSYTCEESGHSGRATGQRQQPARHPPLEVTTANDSLGRSPVLGQSWRSLAKLGRAVRPKGATQAISTSEPMCRILGLCCESLFFVRELPISKPRINCLEPRRSKTGYVQLQIAIFNILTLEQFKNVLSPVKF